MRLWAKDILADAWNSFQSQRAILCAAARRTSFAASLSALRAVLLVGSTACLVTAGCDNMKQEPRQDPLSPSIFFANGASARPPVEGTVASGHLREGELHHTGKIDGKIADAFPFRIDRQALDRGRERFDIFCAPCHDRLGTGNGMIVQRGFTPPPSYHLPRLQEMPVGHFFDVTTSGFGAMYSYAERISPEERWAVAAYIRALQLSQSATLDELPPAERARLQEGLR